MKKAEKLKREQEETQQAEKEKEETSEKGEMFKLETVKTEAAIPDACTVTVEGVEDAPTDNPMGMSEDATDTEDMHQLVIWRHQDLISSCRRGIPWIVIFF